MATESRESLHKLVLSIAQDIDDGKDLGEVAGDLEEATKIADELASADE